MPLSCIFKTGNNKYKEKAMSFIREEYKKEWKFFKTEMKYIFFIMLLLMIVLIVGSHFAVTELFKAKPEALNMIYEMMSSLMEGVDLGEETALVSSVKLFFNNARACLLAILFGVIPFIFFSLYSFLLNGFLVGAVTAFSGTATQLGVGFMLAALLPHGVFEFPAIVYSCALGVYICKETNKIIFKKSSKRISEIVLETLRSYVLVILPLLVAAAFVEAYITMIVAMKFV